MKTIELTADELSIYRDAVSRDEQHALSGSPQSATEAYRAMNAVLKARGIKGDAEKVTVRFTWPESIYSLCYTDEK